MWGKVHPAVLPGGPRYPDWRSCEQLCGPRAVSGNTLTAGHGVTGRASVPHEHRMNDFHFHR